jgi:hypothetical protein
MRSTMTPSSTSQPQARRSGIRGSMALSAAAVSLVVVACSGATTASTQGGSGAGNGASGGSGSDSGASGSGSGSGGGAPGAPQGEDASAATPAGDDSGAVSVPQVDGAACPAKGSEVVMIGDSYFALSETASIPNGEITAHLQGLAGASGALLQGDGYRYYYESGANMSTSYVSPITPIPTQFANAVAANPDIKYVIMDGGGNDILLENNQCITASASTPISAACKTSIQTAISAATTLFQSMKTAGVEKIIYFFYPHLPTTESPSVNIILDYAFPLIQAACQASPVPCYLVDTRPAFAGNPSYIKPDNIHPTTAGSDVIAGLVWSEMLQECVALAP